MHPVIVGRVIWALTLKQRRVRRVLILLIDCKVILIGSIVASILAGNSKAWQIDRQIEIHIDSQII